MSIIPISKWDSEKTKWDDAGFSWGDGNAIYTMESSNDLETDIEPLSVDFSTNDYAVISTDNNDYLDLEGTGTYQKKLFKRYYDGGGNLPVVVTWKGKSSISTSGHPITLQVYNHSTSLWEDLTSNNSANADTEFTLTNTIDTNVSNYFGEDLSITYRVYQV